MSKFCCQNVTNAHQHNKFKRHSIQASSSLVKINTPVSIVVWQHSSLVTHARINADAQTIIWIETLLMAIKWRGNTFNIIRRYIVNNHLSFVDFCAMWKCASLAFGLLICYVHNEYDNRRTHKEGRKTTGACTNTKCGQS